MPTAFVKGASPTNTNAGWSCRIPPGSGRDFTILNVRRQEELYYEHLGRLDESRYVNRNLKKIKDYQRNGIILGERLFVTFETEMRPFDIRDLDVLINKFFL